MAKGYIHWCPVGCGKSVIFSRLKGLGEWTCTRCDKVFHSKEELK